tara:strand:- start:350 stop:721 length:372 start_codon:yes stop_codon:yes gene_type:complete
MTRIFTIIAFLFVTNAWANEVDGNSFYCTGLKNTRENGAMIFKNGKVVMYDNVGKLNEYYYTARDTSVIWFENKYQSYTISRISLELKHWNDEAPSEYTTWQCEFMEINKARRLASEPSKQKN